MNHETYATLLTHYRPRPITDDAEHDRQLAIIDEFLKCGEALPPEEEALLELFTLTVLDYEDRRYPIEPPRPAEMLKHLMESNDLKQKDLVPVLGSSGRVSEILSGKREITWGQAKRLAERFSVSADLFFSW